MKKLSVRVLSFILCVCMVFSLLPVSVFAASGDVVTPKNPITTAGGLVDVLGDSNAKLADGKANTVELQKDIKLAAFIELQPESEIILDLNGHKLERDENGVTVIYLNGDATDTLYIEDSQGNGEIIGGSNDSDEKNPSAAIVAANGNVNIRGGKVTANGAYNDAVSLNAGVLDVRNCEIDGGQNGYAISSHGATINIHSGATIKASRTVDRYSAVILNQNSAGETIPTLNMDGGEIIGTEKCGGVAAFDNATINISGGTITSTNRFALSTNGSGSPRVNITISGNAKLESENTAAVYLPAGTLTVKENAHIEGAAGVVVRGGKLIVENGEIVATGNKDLEIGDASVKTVKPSAVAVDKNEAYSEDGGVEIKGGTIESTQADQNAMSFSNEGKAVEGDAEVKSTFGSTVKVSGGEFIGADNSVVEQVLDDNAVIGGNGMVVNTQTSTGDITVAVGGTETSVATLKEAFSVATAKDGEATITLNAKIAADAVATFADKRVTPADVTLDLNGFGINGAAITVESGKLSVVNNVAGYKNINGNIAISGGELVIGSDVWVDAATGNAISVTDNGKLNVTGTAIVTSRTDSAIKVSDVTLEGEDVKAVTIGSEDDDAAPYILTYGKFDTLDVDESNVKYVSVTNGMYVRYNENGDTTVNRFVPADKMINTAGPEPVKPGNKPSGQVSGIPAGKVVDFKPTINAYGYAEEGYKADEALVSLGAGVSEKASDRTMYVGFGSIVPQYKSVELTVGGIKQTITGGTEQKVFTWTLFGDNAKLHNAQSLELTAPSNITISANNSVSIANIKAEPNNELKNLVVDAKAGTVTTNATVKRDNDNIGQYFEVAYSSDGLSEVDADNSGTKWQKGLVVGLDIKVPTGAVSYELVDAKTADGLEFKNSTTEISGAANIPYYFQLTNDGSTNANLKEWIAIRWLGDTGAHYGTYYIHADFSNIKRVDSARTDKYAMKIAPADLDDHTGTPPLFSREQITSTYQVAGADDEFKDVVDNVPLGYDGKYHVTLKAEGLKPITNGKQTRPELGYTFGIAVNAPKSTSDSACTEATSVKVTFGNVKEGTLGAADSWTIGTKKVVDIAGDHMKDYLPIYLTFTAEELQAIINAKEGIDIEMTWSDKFGGGDGKEIIHIDLDVTAYTPIGTIGNLSFTGPIRDTEGSEKANQFKANLGNIIPGYWVVVKDATEAIGAWATDAADVSEAVVDVHSAKTSSLKGDASYTAELWFRPGVDIASAAGSTPPTLTETDNSFDKKVGTTSAIKIVEATISLGEGTYDENSVKDNGLTKKDDDHTYTAFVQDGTKLTKENLPDPTAPAGTVFSDWTKAADSQTYTAKYVLDINRVNPIESSAGQALKKADASAPDKNDARRATIVLEPKGGELAPSVNPDGSIDWWIGLSVKAPEGYGYYKRYYGGGNAQWADKFTSVAEGNVVNNWMSYDVMAQYPVGNYVGYCQIQIQWAKTSSGGDDVITEKYDVYLANGLKKEPTNINVVGFGYSATPQGAIDAVTAKFNELKLGESGLNARMIGSVGSNHLSERTMWVLLDKPLPNGANLILNYNNTSNSNAKDTNYTIKLKGNGYSFVFYWSDKNETQVPPELGGFAPGNFEIKSVEKDSESKTELLGEVKTKGTLTTNVGAIVGETAEFGFAATKEAAETAINDARHDIADAYGFEWGTDVKDASNNTMYLVMNGDQVDESNKFIVEWKYNSSKEMTDAKTIVASLTAGANANRYTNYFTFTGTNGNDVYSYDEAGTSTNPGKPDLKGGWYKVEAHAANDTALTGVLRDRISTSLYKDQDNLLATSVNPIHIVEIEFVDGSNQNKLIGNGFTVAAIGGKVNVPTEIPFHAGKQFAGWEATGVTVADGVATISEDVDDGDNKITVTAKYDDRIIALKNADGEASTIEPKTEDPADNTKIKVTVKSENLGLSMSDEKGNGNWIGVGVKAPDDALYWKVTSDLKDNAQYSNGSSIEGLEPLTAVASGIGIWTDAKKFAKSQPESGYYTRTVTIDWYADEDGSTKIATETVEITFEITKLEDYKAEIIEFAYAPTAEEAIKQLGEYAIQPASLSELTGKMLYDENNDEVSIKTFQNKTNILYIVFKDSLPEGEHSFKLTAPDGKTEAYTINSKGKTNFFWWSYPNTNGEAGASRSLLHAPEYKISEFDNSPTTGTELEVKLTVPNKMVFVSAGYGEAPAGSDVMNQRIIDAMNSSLIEAEANGWTPINDAHGKVMYAVFTGEKTGTAKSYTVDFMYGNDLVHREVFNADAKPSSGVNLGGVAYFDFDTTPDAKAFVEKHGGMMPGVYTVVIREGTTGTGTVLSNEGKIAIYGVEFTYDETAINAENIKGEFPAPVFGEVGAKLTVPYTSDVPHVAGYTFAGWTGDFDNDGKVDEEVWTQDSKSITVSSSGMIEAVAKYDENVIGADGTCEIKLSAKDDEGKTDVIIDQASVRLSESGSGEGAEHTVGYWAGMFFKAPSKEYTLMKYAEGSKAEMSKEFFNLDTYKGEKGWLYYIDASNSNWFENTKAHYNEDGTSNFGGTYTIEWYKSEQDKNPVKEVFHIYVDPNTITFETLNLNVVDFGYGWTREDALNSALDERQDWIDSKYWDGKDGSSDWVDKTMYVTFEQPLPYNVVVRLSIENPDGSLEYYDCKGDSTSRTYAWSYLNDEQTYGDVKIGKYTIKGVEVLNPEGMKATVNEKTVTVLAQPTIDAIGFEAYKSDVDKALGAIIGDYDGNGAANTMWVTFTGWEIEKPDKKKPDELKNAAYVVSFYREVENSNDEQIYSETAYSCKGVPGYDYFTFGEGNSAASYTPALEDGTYYAKIVDSKGREFTSDEITLGHVTIDSDNGTDATKYFFNVETPKTAAHITAPIANPVKENYKFGGWSVEGKTLEDTVAANETIKAVWLANARIDEFALEAAPIHDNSGLYSDGNLYNVDGYKANMEPADENDYRTITVTAKGLKQHRNGSEDHVLGYWTGVFINRPAAAFDSLEYTFYSDEFVTEKSHGTQEVLDEVNGKSGLTIYSEGTNTSYVEITWLDSAHDDIKVTEKFVINTKVTPFESDRTMTVGFNANPDLANGHSGIKDSGVNTMWASFDDVKTPDVVETIGAGYWLAVTDPDNETEYMLALTEADIASFGAEVCGSAWSFGGKQFTHALETGTYTITLYYAPGYNALTADDVTLYAKDACVEDNIVGDPLTIEIKKMTVEKNGGNFTDPEVSKLGIVNGKIFVDAEDLSKNISKDIFNNAEITKPGYTFKDWTVEGDKIVANWTMDAVVVESGAGMVGNRINELLKGSKVHVEVDETNPRMFYFSFDKEVPEDVNIILVVTDMDGKYVTHLENISSGNSVFYGELTEDQVEPNSMYNIYAEVVFAGDPAAEEEFNNTEWLNSHRANCKADHEKPNDNPVTLTTESKRIGTPVVEFAEPYDHSELYKSEDIITEYTDPDVGEPEIIEFKDAEDHSVTANAWDVKLTGTVKQHLNGGNTPGYWVGVTVNAPCEGAKIDTYGYINEKYVPMDGSSKGTESLTFWFDAGMTAKGTYVVVYWKLPSRELLPEVYKLDWSGMNKFDPSVTLKAAGFKAGKALANTEAGIEDADINTVWAELSGKIDVPGYWLEFKPENAKEGDARYLVASDSTDKYPLSSKWAWSFNNDIQTPDMAIAEGDYTVTLYYVPCVAPNAKDNAWVKDGFKDDLDQLNKGKELVKAVPMGDPIVINLTPYTVDLGDGEFANAADLGIINGNTIYVDGDDAKIENANDFAKAVFGDVTPTQSGYEFKGWTLDGNKLTANFDQIINLDKVIYFADADVANKEIGVEDAGDNTFWFKFNMPLPTGQGVWIILADEDGKIVSHVQVTKTGETKSAYTVFKNPETWDGAVEIKDNATYHIVAYRFDTSAEKGPWFDFVGDNIYNQPTSFTDKYLKVGEKDVYTSAVRSDDVKISTANINDASGLYAEPSTQAYALGDKSTATFKRGAKGEAIEAVAYDVTITGEVKAHSNGSKTGYFGGIEINRPNDNFETVTVSYLDGDTVYSTESAANVEKLVNQDGKSGYVFWFEMNPKASWNGVHIVLDWHSKNYGDLTEVYRIDWSGLKAFDHERTMTVGFNANPDLANDASGIHDSAVNTMWASYDKTLGAGYWLVVTHEYGVDDTYTYYAFGLNEDDIKAFDGEVSGTAWSFNNPKQYTRPLEAGDYTITLYYAPGYNADTVEKLAEFGPQVISNGTKVAEDTITISQITVDLGDGTMPENSGIVNGEMFVDAKDIESADGNVIAEKLFGDLKPVYGDNTLTGWKFADNTLTAQWQVRGYHALNAEMGDVTRSVDDVINLTASVDGLKATASAQDKPVTAFWAGIGIDRPNGADGFKYAFKNADGEYAELSDIVPAEEFLTKNDGVHKGIAVWFNAIDGGVDVKVEWYNGEALIGTAEEYRITLDVNEPVASTVKVIGAGYGDTAANVKSNADAAVKNLQNTYKGVKQANITWKPNSMFVIFDSIIPDGAEVTITFTGSDNEAHEVTITGDGKSYVYAWSLDDLDVAAQVGDYTIGAEGDEYVTVTVEDGVKATVKAATLWVLTSGFNFNPNVVDQAIRNSVKNYTDSYADMKIEPAFNVPAGEAEENVYYMVFKGLDPNKQYTAAVFCNEKSNSNSGQNGWIINAPVIPIESLSGLGYAYAKIELTETVLSYLTRSSSAQAVDKYVRGELFEGQYPSSTGNADSDGKALNRGSSFQIHRVNTYYKLPGPSSNKLYGAYYVTHNSTLGAISHPEFPGYAFTNWSNSPNGGGKWDPETVRIVSSYGIYAQYKRLGLYDVAPLTDESGLYRDDDLLRGLDINFDPSGKYTLEGTNLARHVENGESGYWIGIQLGAPDDTVVGYEINGVRHELDTLKKCLHSCNITNGMKGAKILVDAANEQGYELYKFCWIMQDDSGVESKTEIEPVYIDYSGVTLRQFTTKMTHALNTAEDKDALTIGFTNTDSYGYIVTKAEDGVETVVKECLKESLINQTIVVCENYGKDIVGSYDYKLYSFDCSKPADTWVGKTLSELDGEIKNLTLCDEQKFSIGEYTIHAGLTEEQAKDAKVTVTGSNCFVIKQGETDDYTVYYYDESPETFLKDAGINVTTSKASGGKHALNIVSVTADDTHHVYTVSYEVSPALQQIGFKANGSDLGIEGAESMKNVLHFDYLAGVKNTDMHYKAVITFVSASYRGWLEDPTNALFSARTVFNREPDYRIVIDLTAAANEKGDDTQKQYSVFAHIPDEILGNMDSENFRLYDVQFYMFDTDETGINPATATRAELEENNILAGSDFTRTSTNMCAQFTRTSFKFSNIKTEYQYGFVPLYNTHNNGAKIFADETKQTIPDYETPEGWVPASSYVGSNERNTAVVHEYSWSHPDNAGSNEQPGWVAPNYRTNLVGGVHVLPGQPPVYTYNNTAVDFWGFQYEIDYVINPKMTLVSNLADVNGKIPDSYTMDMNIFYSTKAIEGIGGFDGTSFSSSKGLGTLYDQKTDNVPKGYTFVGWRVNDTDNILDKFNANRNLMPTPIEGLGFKLDGTDVLTAVWKIDDGKVLDYGFSENAANVKDRLESDFEGMLFAPNKELNDVIDDTLFVVFAGIQDGKEHVYTVSVKDAEGNEIHHETFTVPAGSYGAAFYASFNDQLSKAELKGGLKLTVEISAEGMTTIAQDFSFVKASFEGIEGHETPDDLFAIVGDVIEIPESTEGYSWYLGNTKVADSYTVKASDSELVFKEELTEQTAAITTVGFSPKAGELKGFIEEAMRADLGDETYTYNGDELKDNSIFVVYTGTRDGKEKEYNIVVDYYTNGSNYLKKGTVTKTLNNDNGGLAVISLDELAGNDTFYSKIEVKLEYTSRNGTKVSKTYENFSIVEVRFELGTAADMDGVEGLKLPETRLYGAPYDILPGTTYSANFMGHEFKLPAALQYSHWEFSKDGGSDTIKDIRGNDWALFNSGKQGNERYGSSAALNNRAEYVTFTLNKNVADYIHDEWGFEADAAKAKEIIESAYERLVDYNGKEFNDVKDNSVYVVFMYGNDGTPRNVQVVLTQDNNMYGKTFNDVISGDALYVSFDDELKEHGFELKPGAEIGVKIIVNNGEAEDGTYFMTLGKLTYTTDDPDAQDLLPKDCYVKWADGMSQPPVFNPDPIEGYSWKYSVSGGAEKDLTSKGVEAQFGKNEITFKLYKNAPTEQTPAIVEQGFFADSAKATEAINKALADKLHSESKVSDVVANTLYVAFTGNMMPDTPVNYTVTVNDNDNHSYSEPIKDNSNGAVFYASFADQLNMFTLKGGLELNVEVKDDSGKFSPMSAKFRFAELKYTTDDGSESVFALDGETVDVKDAPEGYKWQKNGEDFTDKSVTFQTEEPVIELKAVKVETVKPAEPAIKAHGFSTEASEALKMIQDDVAAAFAGSTFAETDVVANTLYVVFSGTQDEQAHDYTVKVTAGDKSYTETVKGVIKGGVFYASFDGQLSDIKLAAGLDVTVEITCEGVIENALTETFHFAQVSFNADDVEGDVEIPADRFYITGDEVTLPELPEGYEWQIGGETVSSLTVADEANIEVKAVKTTVTPPKPPVSKPEIVASGFAANADDAIDAVNGALKELGSDTVIDDAIDNTIFAAFEADEGVYKASVQVKEGDEWVEKYHEDIEVPEGKSGAVFYASFDDQLSAIEPKAGLEVKVVVGEGENAVEMTFTFVEVQFVSDDEIELPEGGLYIVGDTVTLEAIEGYDWYYGDSKVTDYEITSAEPSTLVFKAVAQTVIPPEDTNVYYEITFSAFAMAEDIVIKSSHAADAEFSEVFPQSNIDRAGYVFAGWQVEGESEVYNVGDKIPEALLSGEGTKEAPKTAEFIGVWNEIHETGDVIVESGFASDKADVDAKLEGWAADEDMNLAPELFDKETGDDSFYYLFKGGEDGDVYDVVVVGPDGETVYEETGIEAGSGYHAGYFSFNDEDIAADLASGEYTVELRKQGVEEPVASETITLSRVTFNANGGAGDIPESKFYNAGSVIVLPEVTQTNYTFNGWFVNDQQITGTYTVPNTGVDIVIEARWTYNGGGGGSIGGGGSGGSGSTRFAINIADSEHGTVTANPTTAAEGSRVTLTVTPDEGYELGGLSVTDNNGNRVNVTENSDGTYTFTMPNGRVNVRATFVEAGSGAYDQYTDVAADGWYRDAVEYAVEHGLMNGMSDTTFAPNMSTTRGMIVTILYRLEGEPEVTGAQVFDDVDPNEWYGKAVEWASANGIVLGYGDGNYGPMDEITREQMAAILYRYAEYKGYDTTGRGDLSVFSDENTVSEYAVDPISWANAMGLVNGRSVTTLAPKGDATRAEVAALLMRFCLNVAGLE